MYSPFIRAFNYTLDRLSGLKVPGLPDFQENRQIAFARSDEKCIESESYLQGSYKPDIVLVKWNMFTRVHQRAGAVYSESYETDICCESGCEQPTLSWRNLLSTVEVKRGGPGGAGNIGRGLPGVKPKKKSAKSVYNGDFGNLRGDLEAARPSEPPKPAPLKMVNEGNSTRHCTFIALLSASSHPHQFQLGHALAREARRPHLRLQVGKLSHNRRGTKILNPPEAPRRNSKGTRTQNLVGQADRG